MTNKHTKYFTSESVSAGHPDKMADLISDSVLDYVLARYPNGRVACETMLTANNVYVAGEITTSADLSGLESLVYGIIRGIDKPYADAVNIVIDIDKQSQEIANGVDVGGAGDQGLMFGYATNETPSLMPLPITVANELITALDMLRSYEPRLLADAKTQVTVTDNNDIDTIVVSTRHTDDLTIKDVRERVKPVINDVLQRYGTSVDNVKLYVNPAGSFTVGGAVADVGLTGRKIIVDTYGGIARHGGGAFSGKDATKVDRSGAYLARYIAKNIVAAELANKCEVQVAYAIGVAEPVSVRVDTFGTSGVAECTIEKAVREVFDMTPQGIIKSLDLRKPIYASTAVGGHFGRDGFTWEKTDKVSELLKAVSTAD